MPATPTIPTIRSAIVLAIKTAMNAGTPANVLTVHPYWRFWRDEQKFMALFRRTAPDLLPGKINGWMVRRGATEEIETEEWFRFYQLHRFEMIGYAGVQDDDASGLTEKDFQDQVEAVRDQLRLSGGVFTNTERTSPVVQVESVKPVTIGQYTCWEAFLSLKAEGIENKFS